MCCICVCVCVSEVTIGSCLLSLRTEHDVKMKTILSEAQKALAAHDCKLSITKLSIVLHKFNESEVNRIVYVFVLFPLYLQCMYMCMCIIQMGEDSNDKPTAMRSQSMARSQCWTTVLKRTGSLSSPDVNSTRTISPE